MGIPGMLLPSSLYPSTRMYVICPFVTSWEIPLPAVNRIRVATMGCILSFATSKPLKPPHTTAAARAASTART